MYNKLKNKYSICGPGEEPAEEEAVDEAEAVADDTKVPSTGQHLANCFSMDGKLFCCMDHHLLLQTSKSNSSN
jgi:hypothetical protein